MQETNQLLSVPGWENSKKTELKKIPKFFAAHWRFSEDLKTSVAESFILALCSIT